VQITGVVFNEDRADNDKLACCRELLDARLGEYPGIVDVSQPMSDAIIARLAPAKRILLDSIHKLNNCDLGVKARSTKT